MPIPVSCACGHRFAAVDALAGKQVNCPACGRSLAVLPAGGAAPRIPPAPGAPYGGYSGAPAMGTPPGWPAAGTPGYGMPGASAPGMGMPGTGMPAGPGGWPARAPVAPRRSRGLLYAAIGGGGAVAILLIVVLAIVLSGGDGGPANGGAGAGAPATYPPATLPGAETGVPTWVGTSPTEPFDVRRFLLERQLPADNAAPLYFLAFAEVSTEMDFAYPPDEWEQRLPHVQALSDAIDGLYDLDRMRDRSVPVAEAERVVGQGQEALARLDAAQAKPNCVFASGWALDTEIGHAIAARQFAKLLSLQQYVAGSKGDFALAEHAVHRTLRLSRDLRPRNPLISQLVSMAIDGTVFQMIADHTLSQPGLTAADCDRLLALLAEHRRDGVPMLHEGMRGEYTFIRHTLEEVRAGRLDYKAKLQELQGLNPDYDYRLSEVPDEVDARVEIAALDKAFAEILTLLDKPHAERLSSGWEAREVQLVNESRAQGAAVVAHSLPELSSVLGAEARIAARLAATEALIAVRRYEVAHGQPPVDLATAVREAGLAAVPTDPYDGQPLRYAVLNGEPVVYSVGHDRKDDGGQDDADWRDQDGDFVARYRK